MPAFAGPTAQVFILGDLSITQSEILSRVAKELVSTEKPHSPSSTQVLVHVKLRVMDVQHKWLEQGEMSREFFAEDTDLKAGGQIRGDWHLNRRRGHSQWQYGKSYQLSFRRMVLPVDQTS